MRPGGDAASYRALDPGGPKKLPKKHLWRGGRVVECTALEMRRAWKGTVGSNPTLSAIPLSLVFAPCRPDRARANLGLAPFCDRDQE